MKRLAVISDIHMNLKDDLIGDESKILEQSLSNLEVDGIAICGDITEHAHLQEWEAFFNIYKECCKDKKLFLIPGNMDATEYQEGRKLFLDNYGVQSGLILDKTYFAYEADNFIVIGISPEEDDDDTPLSDMQLHVIEESIKQAAERMVPAIILGHYILNDTIQVDWKYAYLGVQSSKIRTIFERYCVKVIYFSGHIHRGLIKEPRGSVVTLNNVTYISVPSLCQPDNIHYHADNDQVGTGYILELGDKDIRIRGYNFLTRAWLETFEWII